MAQGGHLLCGVIHHKSRYNPNEMAFAGHELFLKKDCRGKSKACLERWKRNRGDVSVHRFALRLLPFPTCSAVSSALS